MLFSKKKIKEIILQNKELEWAHIYHDSIRGKEYLEKLPLNIGRWAGSYSFFYVLNRILSDYKPNSILDLGLGESSKFINAFMKNSLPSTTHVVVEQDQDWIDVFSKNTTLTDRSRIVHCPLEEITVKGHKSNSYKDFKKNVNQKFDLYIVDGPFGSERYSRYNIIELIKDFTPEDEFIILFDDCEREGEKDTVKDIFEVLKKKNIVVFSDKYIGNKTQYIIATQKYKFATSF